MVSITSISDPTINLVEKKVTGGAKQISPELKNDYSKVLQKFDQYSGNCSFNQNIPIDSPAGLQFPTKIKTDLGERMEQIRDTGNISHGMMPAHTKSNSMSWPDVCRVPAPPAPFCPAPYPNIEFASKALAKIITSSNSEIKDVSQAAELITKAMFKMMGEGSPGVNSNEMRALLDAGPQIFEKTLENIIGKGGSISNADKSLIKSETGKFENNLLTKVLNTLGIDASQLPKEITLRAAFKTIIELMSDAEQKTKPKAEKALGKETVNIGYQGTEITTTLVTKGPAATWSMIREASSDKKVELLTTLMLANQSNNATSAQLRTDKLIYTDIVEKAVKEVLNDDLKEIIMDAVRVGIETAKTNGKSEVDTSKISEYILTEMGKKVSDKLTPIIKVDAVVLEMIRKSIVESPIVKMSVFFSVAIVKNYVESPMGKTDTIILEMVVKGMANKIAPFIKLAEQNLDNTLVKNIMERIAKADTTGKAASNSPGTSTGKEGQANAAIAIFERVIELYIGLAKYSVDKGYTESQSDLLKLKTEIAKIDVQIDQLLDEIAKNMKA